MSKANIISNGSRSIRVRRGGGKNLKSTQRQLEKKPDVTYSFFLWELEGMKLLLFFLQKLIIAVKTKRAGRDEPNKWRES